jgi:hypothetical protein
VIDIPRIVPPDASIDVTVRVEFTDALTTGPSHPPHSLAASNPFAGVFGYEAVFRKPNVRETTDTIEERRQDRHAAIQLAPVTWDGTSGRSADGL